MSDTMHTDDTKGMGDTMGTNERINRDYAACE